MSCLIQVYVTLAALAVNPPSHPDGSVLVLQNSKKLVSRWIDSEFTHVAPLLNQGGETWVYEAAPSKVVRITLTDYLRKIGEQNRGRDDPTTIWVLHPKERFTEAESERLRAFLAKQLGRPYSVRGYIRGKPGAGVHCAELTAGCLRHAMGITAGHTFDENPATVVRLIDSGYEAPVAVKALEPAKEPSWCSSTWQNFTDGLRWCGWACHESWSWCW